MKMRTTDVFFRKIPDDGESSCGSHTYDFDEGSGRRPFLQIYRGSNTSSHEQRKNMTYFPGDRHLNEEDEAASNVTYMQMMSQDGGVATMDIPDHGVLPRLIPRPAAGPQCNRYLDMTPRNTTPLATMTDSDTTTKRFTPLTTMTDRAARRYYNWPHERSVMRSSLRWWWWWSVDRGRAAGGGGGTGIRSDDIQAPSTNDYYIQPDVSFPSRQQQQYSGGGEGRYLPMSGKK